MKTYKFIPLLFLVILISGCAPKMYKWNGYDDALYKYYKNPNEREAFVNKINSIITEGEKADLVPPGVYAEYGYLHYEEGKYAEAIKYFQKEYDKWPESRIFMQKMIRNANLALEKQRTEAINKQQEVSSEN